MIRGRKSSRESNCRFEKQKKSRTSNLHNIKLLMDLKAGDRGRNELDRKGEERRGRERGREGRNGGIGGAKWQMVNPLHLFLFCFVFNFFFLLFIF